MSTKQSAFPENAKECVSRIFSTTNKSGITEIRTADSYVKRGMAFADMGEFRSGAKWELVPTKTVLLAVTVENQSTKQITGMQAYAIQYGSEFWLITLGKAKTPGVRYKTYNRDATPAEIQNVLMQWAKTTAYRNP